MSWLIRTMTLGKRRYAEGFWDGIPFGAALCLIVFLVIMTASHWWYS